MDDRDRRGRIPIEDLYSVVIDNQQTVVTLQFSVYSRITQNHDDAKKHIMRLSKNLPPKGSVRVMQVTEKQYNSMIIMVGKRTATEDFLTPVDFIEL